MRRHRDLTDYSPSIEAWQTDDTAAGVAEAHPIGTAACAPIGKNAQPDNLNCLDGTTAGLKHENAPRLLPDLMGSELIEHLVRCLRMHQLEIAEEKALWLRSVGL
jgi:hypothetical protein